MLICIYAGISHYISDRKCKGRRKSLSSGQQKEKGFALGNSIQRSQAQKEITVKGIY
jgi:hypothetical protein